MGKIETKPLIKDKKAINCKIKTDIMCPLCNQIIKRNATYNQLNAHLKECEFHYRRINNDRIYVRQKSNGTNKNLAAPKLHNVLDENTKKEENKSDPLRTKHKKSINASDMNTVNDFQLVIDYNNTKNLDLYEEQLKNDGQKEQIYDKYAQLQLFLLNKKNLMNFDLDAECTNYREAFYVIKNCNIYYNTRFVLQKKTNAQSHEKPRILNMNYVLNKYLDFMIKNHIFYNINDTLYFSFNTKKVDYEMIGIILSILLIYPEIKLTYKFPLILCKLLVNQRLELNDIKYTNTDLYHSLYELSNDKDINSKELFYIYEGNELLIEGKNTRVTNENIFDYIEKIINYQFRKYKIEIGLIKTNLFLFIPKKYIFFFNGEELYRMINRTF
jgi:hypothetical protein